MNASRSSYEIEKDVVLQTQHKYPFFKITCNFKGIQHLVW